MKWSYSLAIIYFGLATSCTSSTVFLKKQTLSQELMPLKGITYPCYIEIKHPYLIIENCNRNDSIFHIYNTNNHVLQSVFGVYGRGPGEFLSPYLFNTQMSNLFIENGEDIVYVFAIDSVGNPVFKDSKLPNYIEGVLGAALINDSLYVRDGMFTAAELQLLTFGNELPRKSWQYRNPNINNCFIDPDYGHIYANSSLIVLCYNLKKQIDFMDINLRLIKRVKFKYSFSENITEDNQFDIKVSYSAGYLGKRYLYVLFRDASWNEYKELSHRKSSLEVFDLEGNPICIYEFNGVIPHRFVVDEENFTLYGIRDDGEPENYVIVYKLTGLS